MSAQFTRVSQPQREALALQLLTSAPSRGATLFQVRRMAHQARWGGHDVQLLRKLRIPRQDPGFLTFVNEFGEFNIAVVGVDQATGESGRRPQNQRLYRIFREQMSRA